MQDLLQRTIVPSLHRSTPRLRQPRTPETSRGITQIISSHPSSSCIHVVQLDVKSEDSITHTVSYIKDFTNKRIDLLLKVARILGKRGNTPGPERYLLQLQHSWTKKIMVINIIRPLLIASSPRPPSGPGPGAGGGGGRKEDSAAVPYPTAVFANLSARAGSISDNGLG